MNLRRIIAKGLRQILQPAAITESIVDHRARICSGSQVNFSQINRYSYVGHDCFLLNADIGGFCSIADNCRIGGANHPIYRVSTSPVFHKGKNVLKKNFSYFDEVEEKQIKIGVDVWIGANVCILSGVTIGTGAIIGAGSIITKDIPEYEIWAGNPATKIKDRFDPETIKKLNEIAWWTWSDDMIAKYADCFDDPNHLINCLESKK